MLLNDNLQSLNERKHQQSVFLAAHPDVLLRENITSGPSQKFALETFQDDCYNNLHALSGQLAHPSVDVQLKQITV